MDSLPGKRKPLVNCPKHYHFDFCPTSSSFSDHVLVGIQLAHDRRLSTHENTTAPPAPYASLYSAIDTTGYDPRLARVNAIATPTKSTPVRSHHQAHVHREEAP